MTSITYMGSYTKSEVLKMLNTPSSAFSGGGSRWIYARPGSAGQHEQQFVGKWLIFVSCRDVDNVWERVRHAVTEGGLLGDSIGAKVSIFDPSRRGHVICVYNADHRDKATVSKCLAELRKIGIRGRLSYKADAQTRAGISGSMYASDMFESKVRKLE